MYKISRDIIRKSKRMSLRRGDKMPPQKVKSMWGANYGILEKAKDAERGRNFREGNGSYEVQDLDVESEYKALPRLELKKPPVDLIKDLKINAKLLYKNSQFLANFVDTGGELLAQKKLGLTDESYEMIDKAVKRAKILGFMPFLCRRVIVASSVKDSDNVFDYNAKAVTPKQTSFFTLYK